MNYSKIHTTEMCSSECFRSFQIPEHPEKKSQPKVNKVYNDVVKGGIIGNSFQFSVIPSAVFTIGSLENAVLKLNWICLLCKSS